ncbi:polysaccharide biosynthesis/export family protein [Methylomagnum sp.]
MQLRNILVFLGFILAFAAFGDTANPASLSELPHDYRIVPGDVLEISVWREEGLNNKVLVRPDGGVSYPLIGGVAAGGLTVEQLRGELKGRLAEFLSDPEVAVSVVNSNQRVYVVGKVNKPGDFPMPNRMSVLQALAMAGGLTPFADRDDIGIIRRVGPETRRLPFDYDSAEDGENLEQNILLENGDVVVVP